MPGIKNSQLPKTGFDRLYRLNLQMKKLQKGLLTLIYIRLIYKSRSCLLQTKYCTFQSEEYHIALGLCYMNLQKKSKAYLQFEKALAINNGNKEVKKYMNEIKSGKNIIEISALAGMTGFAGESKFGLRQIQPGYHVNNEILVYARYDNALSQDNYFFLKNNYNANAFFGGVYYRWHTRVGSKFEYGYRNLPGKMHQNIFQTEQTIFLPKNFAVKLEVPL